VLKLDPSRQAEKFLRSLPEKHAVQIARKISSLLVDPLPHDAKQLKGHDFLRADVGEYRIIYKAADGVLYLALIGKRNDDEVYRLLSRMPKK
jgi:mRNA interferase RelE/StbE